jgi:hypothetical protein
MGNPKYTSVLGIEDELGAKAEVRLEEGLIISEFGVDEREVPLTIELAAEFGIIDMLFCGFAKMCVW